MGEWLGDMMQNGPTYVDDIIRNNDTDPKQRFLANLYQESAKTQAYSVPV